MVAVECCVSASLGLGKSLGDVFPVGDVPDCLDEVRSQVLVLQIVRVFPDVNRE